MGKYENALGKRRQEVLKAMYRAAVNMVRTGWTRVEENAIWRMAISFNDDLCDNEADEYEIYMGEMADESGVVCGFMIEDEPYYYDQMPEVRGHKYTVYNEAGDWSFLTDNIYEAKEQVYEFGGRIVVNTTNEEILRVGCEEVAI